MSHHETYGTGAHTATDLAQLLSSRLGLVFDERESDFWGTYHRAVTPDREIRVQPNAVPGDDGMDELSDPELPASYVFVTVTTATPDPALRAGLASIEGLVLLGP